MKHAIMVIGYGKGTILQQTISILDDKDIDFFIHWDKRYPIPKLYSKKSKIFFIKNRIKVKWGSYTLIKVTLQLMQKIKNSGRKYSYIHLISSNDLPLMTASYFKKYFKKEVYLGFHHPVTRKITERVDFYYPNNIDYRIHPFIRRGLILLNRILRIRRLSREKLLKIKKGPEWFSIKYKYMDEILSYSCLNDFKYALCADEIFIQTILGRFDTKNNLDENAQAARYIDWKRGFPYVFSDKDINELEKNINKDFAFVRKIRDPHVFERMKKIYGK